MDVRSLLSLPQAYNLFSRLVAGGGGGSALVADELRPRPGLRVLDIGCGTGTLLDRIPGVDYVGFDLSERYIAHARKRRGARGEFHARAVDADVVRELNLKDFDVVVAKGVVHHLDDAQALDLFTVAGSAMKRQGLLLTLDPCFVDGQSPVARWIISKDRGEHVRELQGYLDLARAVFNSVEPVIRHDLLRIPYTHLLLRCRSPRLGG